jgi:hypothetical protein
MFDRDDAITKSWATLGPRILSDPHELTRRLARGRTPTPTLPPPLPPPASSFLIRH